MQRLKRTVLSMILFAITPFAVATGISPYVGVLGGRSVGSWKLIDREGSAQIISRRDRLTGWSGYFSGGALFDVNSQFSMGMEFGYGVSNAEFAFVSTVANSNDYYDFRHYYTLGLLPTVWLNGQGLYANIAASWAALKYSTTIASQLPARFKSTRVGGLVGLGVVAPITPYIALRTEYQWSRYQKITRAGTAGQISWTPNQDTYLMGLNFYFMPQDNRIPTYPLGSDWYVGVGVGRDLPALRRRQDTAGRNVFYWPQGLSGALARVIGGYTFALDYGINISPEAVVSYSSAGYSDSILTNAARSFNYAMEDSYGLRTKLGICTSEANAVFGLAGGVLGHFKKTGGQNFGNNFNHYRLGWQIGFGDEFAITQSMALRFEGDYARFLRIKTGTAEDNSRYRWKPTDEQATLTLIYRL